MRKVTERRLRDGERAAAARSTEPKTLEEARELVEGLWDGVRALQSLDDLGSPEANEASWNRMVALSKRAKELEKKWPALKKS